MALALPVVPSSSNRSAITAILRHMNGHLSVVLTAAYSTPVIAANVYIIHFKVEAVLVASKLLKASAITAQDLNLLMVVASNAKDRSQINHVQSAVLISSIPVLLHANYAILVEVCLSKSVNDASITGRKASVTPMTNAKW
jgi:hypothetical protein